MHNGLVIAESPTTFYMPKDAADITCGFKGCEDPAVWYCEAVSFRIRGKTGKPLGDAVAALHLCIDHVATLNVYGGKFELAVEVVTE